MILSTNKSVNTRASLILIPEKISLEYAIDKFFLGSSETEVERNRKKKFSNIISLTIKYSFNYLGLFCYIIKIVKSAFIVS